MFRIPGISGRMLGNIGLACTLVGTVCNTVSRNDQMRREVKREVRRTLDDERAGYSYSRLSEIKR